MSAYDVATIEKPPHFKIGHLRSGRSRRPSYVIGFDTEAGYHAPGDGIPFLLQFSLPGQDETETELIELDETPQGGCFARFMEFVARHCTNQHYEYLIYGFNLAYEWTQLFGNEDDDFRSTSELILPGTVRIGEKESEWEWHLYNDKRVFAVIRNIRRKTMVRILDAQMFYPTSGGLDNVAKILGLGGKTGGIDRAAISRALIHDPHFRTYAGTDAYITRRIGEYIVGLHEQYDVRTSISAPHFASQVFRHSYLRTPALEPIDNELEQHGLWSYHGGKNGKYTDGPIALDGVWNVDITSAYPEAMRALPDLEHSSWQRVKEFIPEAHGIYSVTISYRRCAYRGILNHDGTWPESGYIENISVTGYELAAMLERDEADILAIRGWVMDGPSGTGALVDYVDEFFAMKARAQGAERETAKLFLNSLYGKFFQKIALGLVGFLDAETGQIIEHDPESPYDWRAGGLYHPPIASLITGFVRGKIHRLEHQFGALMTSTDGLFGVNAPDPSQIGKHLGGLTAQRGSLKLWRERVYVFTPDGTCDCAMDGKPCGSCNAARHANSCPVKPKSAYHGFWGCHEQLESIPLVPGTYDYDSRHMVTLKESLKLLDGRQYRAGTFATLPRTITI